MPPNYGQSCGNCGIVGCNSCEKQGVCSPGFTQCSGNKHQTCSSSCGWSNSGTDADGDGVDQQCEDSTCDNAAGVCDTTVSGKCTAKTSTETVCTDSLDNDCDSSVDCSDSDCAGSISGNVKDTNNKVVDNAKIDVLRAAKTEYTEYTQPLGNYQINNVLCGNYDMIASEPKYVSSTKININLAPKESKTVDFTGNDALVLGTTCEDDCTYAKDGLIHKECSGKNGCAFYDNIAADGCNLAKPGWLRAYNDTASCPDGCLINNQCVTCEVECAENAPMEKIKTKAVPSCPEDENLLKTTKLVVYKGKLAKLHVVVCG